jgi:hypothetical protein
MSIYTIEDVQRDWRCLDTPDFEAPQGVPLVSHERFTDTVGHEDIGYIAPGGFVSLFRFSCVLFNLLYAWRLLRRTKNNAVLILNGSCVLWFYVGLLNRFLMLHKRRILLWDPFVEVADGWKRAVMSAAMSSMALIVVWSRRQIESHAAWLGLPAARFVFIPYKANHSKGPCYEPPVESYVFSGGNGKRDYQTLCEAVRGTGIPVVISATDPVVRGQIERLPNVIPLAAWEPSFAQLQAGARLIVIPMIHTGLKAGGETNMCNGMWHGKPVIAADCMAAEDYIVEGETGYIVPPGDAALLRQRIVELWNDPEKCRQMGRKAKEHVQANFTHQAVMDRVFQVARLCGRR